MRVLEPVVDDLRITPRKLNRKSGGKHISARLTLAPGIRPADVDISSLRLIVDGYTILPVSSNAADQGRAWLTVKFDRQSITDVLEKGTARMAVTGAVNDRFFQVSASIEIK